MGFKGNRLSESNNSLMGILIGKGGKNCEKSNSKERQDKKAKKVAVTGILAEKNSNKKRLKLYLYFEIPKEIIGSMWLVCHHPSSENLLVLFDKDSLGIN